MKQPTQMSHTLTPRRWLVLISVALTAAFGDTCLSLGMRHVGMIPLGHGAATVVALLMALRQPWIVAGIVLLLGFFGAQITALSWADLTYVLPVTSFSYIVMTLMARLVLHEQVSASRWAGVLFITVGVGFVTRGPSLSQTVPQDGLVE